MELTPRLRAVADMVSPGALFADIGTDHAYLPAWLLQHGVIDHAVAADINCGPLERARETAKKYSLEANIDFRLCDGLAGVCAEEVNVIAIAGMGGDTIAHILSRAPWTQTADVTLLLQPMTSQPELRRWLYENGFRIEEERIVREGVKIYIILRVRAGQMKEPSLGELWAGKQSREELRGDYIDHVIGKVRRRLNGHQAAAHPDMNTVRMYEQLLSELNAMKKEWSTWQP